MRVNVVLPSDSLLSGLPKGFCGEMLRCDLCQRKKTLWNNNKKVIHQ
jgi:hypothetical protein